MSLLHDFDLKAFSKSAQKACISAASSGDVVSKRVMFHLDQTAVLVSSTFLLWISNHVCKLCI